LRSTRALLRGDRHSRWEWPELRAGSSTIQGFGLYPRAGGEVNWEKLERPLALPYLGKETEVESASQARVLRSVLSGCFDLCRRDELFTPKGHVWARVTGAARWRLARGREGSRREGVPP